MKSKRPPQNRSKGVAQKGLFQVMREKMRLAHMSPFTEKTYIGWCRRYIHFHKGTHPREMGNREITEFLSALAVQKKVAASTQNQALNSLVYLYTEVLKLDPGIFEGITWATRPRHIPVVLSVEEVRLLLSHLKGIQQVVGCLLYGTGGIAT